MSTSTVQLICTSIAGTKITVIANDEMVDGVGHILVVQNGIVAEGNVPENGPLILTVPATDQFSPEVSYTIRVTSINSVSELIVTQIPLTNGTTQYLDNLTSMGAVTGVSSFLLGSNNLSDLGNAGTARTNLGLGSAALAPASQFAPLASPVFTGSPAAPTQSPGDTSTKLATDQFVATAVAGISGGNTLTQTTTKTSAYTATANQLVLCDISAGSFTVTLPSAPAAGTLFCAGIVAVSGVGVNTLTLATGGTDVFDKTGGAVTATMTLLHQSVLYEYNSGVWAKVASADPYLQVAQSRKGTWYLDQFAGTDDQKMTLALAAVIAAGSGTIQLSPRAHTFANQWATTYSGSSSYAIRIIGSGGPPHGASEGPPSGTTVCNLSYAGSGAARMDFQHAGSIEIDHILFKDSGGSAVPFFQTTNAQPYLHDSYFVGSATGTSCFQDAIYLGGLGITAGSGDTAPFQAYEGVVERCSFYGIRTCGWARTFANNVVFRDCLTDFSCGSPNLIKVTDGAMTAASAVLTCATSTPFTSGMVGQTVLVPGAGMATQGSLLVAVITVFTSSSQVTLSCAASATVSAATVTAPTAAAFQIGSSAATGGVEGVVIDDCCIETTAYAVGVLLQQSKGNAVMATSFWDGVANVSLASIVCVNGSSANTFIIPENNQPTGVPAWASEYIGTNAGQDTVMAPYGPLPMMQLPGLTLQGSHPLLILGTNSGTAGLAAGISFGPAGGPATAQVSSDAAGDIWLRPAAGGSVLANGGTNANSMLLGCAANYADLGPLGTGDVWYSVGGSATNININLRCQGNGSVKMQSKLASQFASATTIAANAAAGGGATVSVSGNDQRGTITLTTGTSPSAGDQLTVTFTASGGSYPVSPFVVVCGQGTAISAALEPYVVSAAVSNFHLGAAVGPAASTVYTFNYIVMG